ncbi:DUF6185 family protein [Streptomyces naphthomycinicus]|uniref:DUF6185 family protein n=1 Tax=Streptomyces naphthomycinicus TaxID=2872625 RepID=UPI001CECF8CC|nr:DUF6185 family protein [Streptomyces sp. TML10]
MRGLLSVPAAVLFCLLAAPAAGWAAEPTAPPYCRSARLDGARVGTSVVLEHDNRTYTKIVTRLTLDVPQSWPLSRDLLLSENSDRYATAMACLTRTGGREQRRWSEWRAAHPEVTWKGDHVRVVYRAHAWANEYHSDIDVGLWRLRVGARYWTVRLMVPPALARARWERISVDPGTPGAEWARPSPTGGTGATALIWQPKGTAAKGDAAASKGRDGAAKGDAAASEGRDGAAKGDAAASEGRDGAAKGDAAASEGREGAAKGDAASKGRAAVVEPRPVPAVVVGIKPAWQRSWSAQNGRLSALGLDFLGRLLWACLVSALLLVAARRYLRRPGTATADQSRTLANLRRWAGAAVGVYALVCADLLIEQGFTHFAAWPGFGDQLFIEYGLALFAVLVLFEVAGWSRWWALGACMALNPVVAISAVRLSHRLLGMGGALSAQIALSFCFVAVTLLAFTAALWRIAADGRLLPESRRFPGRDRMLRPGVAGPAVLAATTVIGVCYALAERRDWLRASWLSDATVHAYGPDRLEDYAWQAMWAVSFLQELVIGNQAWLLTAVAVLAALRAWRLPGSPTPLADPGDRLLFLTFFAVTVGLSGGTHLADALPTGLWIPLNMLALYGTTALLARRSVLAQPFVLSGRPLATVAGPRARTRLLRKSRAYREIHAELRRLDQGLFGDEPPQRDALERRLEKLHDWPANVPPAGHDRLPAKISVVDAALALGPRDDWWGNGRRGALFALIPGLPAAVLGAWAWGIRGEAWQDTLSDMAGMPALVFDFLYWMVTWAAAGFVLGALWRALPGRRGAVKAIPVTAAFAVPAGLDALVGWFLDESTSNFPLQLSMMLLVLTVTGIMLDFDTFGGERRYWQSRMGLLLSVYQMRYYSLQVAYVIAQIIAMITIWQFFTEPDVVPAQGGTPPDAGGG